jgi:hypothetical protein
MNISILKHPVFWLQDGSSRFVLNTESVNCVALDPRLLYFQRLMLFTGFRKSLENVWGTRGVQSIIVFLHIL